MVFKFYGIYCCFILRYILYVEVVVNGMFGVGKDGLINVLDFVRKYILFMVEIVVFDVVVYEVLMDLIVIIDLVKVEDKLK